MITHYHIKTTQPVAASCNHNNPNRELYEALQNRTKTKTISPLQDTLKNRTTSSKLRRRLHSRQFLHISETLQYLCALDEVEDSHPLLRGKVNSAECVRL